MFLVLAGFFFQKVWNRPAIPYVELESLYKVSEEQKKPVETCLSQQQCVFVYVAPWCPACHSFLQEFEQIKNMLAAQSVGMVIVVGAEKEEQKKIDLQAKYPQYAVLDTTDNEFMKKHKVAHYPYFIVAGPDRRVYHTDRSATNFMEDKINSRSKN
jgi:thiol-disulfide isomerase/thioredoxin